MPFFLIRFKKAALAVLLAKTFYEQAIPAHGAFHVNQQRPRVRDNLWLRLAPQQLGTFERLEPKDQRRKVSTEFYGLYDGEGPVPFQSAWTIQQNLQQAQFDQMSSELKSGKADLSLHVSPDSLDTVLFVQHEPVFTFGTASDYDFLLNVDTDIPIFDISRGGEITYHGPGQLVVYPILNLRNYQQDLHWYIRALEEAAILAISSKLRDDASEETLLTPTRCNDITGVWLDNHKVAAIGVHARRWVTQHGVAINVEGHCLEPFEQIVPCGLVGRKVGCLNQFLNRPITVSEFVPYMMRAMESIFQMDLETTTNSQQSEAV